MKIDEHDRVIFSTGKTVYAHMGIIGIRPSLRVTEGYDGGFPAWQDGWGSGEGSALTPGERQELADFMIALWSEFRAAAAPKEKQ